MSHNDLNDPEAKSNDLKHERQENMPADRGLILNAVSVLLYDICFTRFKLLMVTEQDPSEAAKEVIESLDRYDFLSDLAVTDTSYLKLKKQIENDIGNEAERVIREQNPR